MLDIKALEKNQPNPDTQVGYLDEYKKSLEERGGSPKDVDQILEINKQRKSVIVEMETLKAKQNKVGQEIAQLKRNKEDASEPLAEMQSVSQQAKDLEHKLHEIAESLNLKLMSLPNKSHYSVHHGICEKDNQTIRTVGEVLESQFKMKEHWELGESLGILDFERAGKVTGARFVFLRQAGSAMERALMQFMMDLHVKEHGYEEMIPPFIANTNTMLGTGQFPKFKEDVFHLAGTDYYMIPTAEVPVTNFYSDETLKEEHLPQKFVAYTPCFRAEAGSYGKDTKGLIRQHQFNKVELVNITHPDLSYEALEKMVQCAEKVLTLLELPYRVVNLCSGDIGFNAAKTYDLEVWLPGQRKYREISSCSNCEAHQARRANIRFRPSGPKARPQFVHTLNGSGLAVGRTLIAVLENYQQEDGSVKVPRVLQNYMGGLTEIKRP